MTGPIRLITAAEHARMGWHGRARLHLARIALVEQLKAEHRRRYPDAHKPFCEEAGCRNHTRALGLCMMHYRRWRRAAA